MKCIDFPSWCNYMVCLTKSGSHPHECPRGNVEMYVYLSKAEADMALTLAVVLVEISVLTMPLSLVSADPAV